jgi:hypothetical protein
MSEDSRPHRRIINDRNDVFATAISIKGKLWSKMREARIVTEIVEENIKVSAFILQEHKTYLYLINVDKLDGLNSTDYIFAFFQYGKTPYEQKR